jgi:hypothetical protein
MIDATKSPIPAWKRYATIGLLATVIAVAGYFVWTKELHPHAPRTSSPAVSVPQTKTARSGSVTGSVPTASTLSISPQDPFG